jgi:hypothetical protein
VPSRAVVRDLAAPKHSSAAQHTPASVDSAAALGPDAVVSGGASAPDDRAVIDASRAASTLSSNASSNAARELTHAKTRVKPVTKPGAAAAPEPRSAAAEASAQTSPEPPALPDHTERGGGADARAELALIERMYAVLRAAEPDAALALCADHAKRWPRGLFIEEREAVRAIASCALRTDDAATLATVFMRKHPHAPTAPRVVAACAPLLAAKKAAASD